MRTQILGTLTIAVALSCTENARGLEYYAAIWANDQAEYIGPFFAFSGDRLGILSAMNCYRLFARYMNPQYEPLPSSIVAEGDTIWSGAGDRGDQAMIAYGASRFALARNSRLRAGLTPAVMSENPHLKWQNSRRGYVVCHFAKDDCTADYRTVPYVTRPGAPVDTASKWRVEHGRPGITKL